MGLTCASAHLFVGDATDGTSVLTTALTSIGYEPVESNDLDDCDLAAVGSAPWMSLFDLANPDVATAELLDIAKRASVQTRRPIVVTGILDSDEFGYVIYNKGRKSDSFATNVELIPFPARKSYPKERADRWSELFGTAISPEDVKLVARSPDTFADERLIAMSRLLGIPIDQTTMTSRALSDIEFRGYRRSHRAASTVAKQQLGDRPDPKPLDALVGQQVNVSFEVEARHAGVSNPTIEISGTAIEHGMFELSEAGGLWHCGVKHITSGGVQNFVGQTAANRRGVICVDYPALGADAFAQAPKPTVSIVFWASLLSIGEGQGSIRCRLRLDEQTSDVVDLQPEFTAEIDPKAKWIPRGCGGQPFEQTAVRILNRPRVLSGVSILEDSPESIATLRKQIELWIASRLWPSQCTASARYEGQMRGVSFSVPKRKAMIPVNEIPQSKPWNGFFARPANLQSLLVQIQTSEGMPLAGATLQRTCDDDPPVEGTIHLGLWLATEASHLDDGSIAHERRVLAKIIDEHFEPLSGIQAWIGHWDWIPQFDLAEERNDTPYEDAVSVNSIKDPPSDFSYAEWCRRYLRSVGDDIWLSESLLAHIDRDALVNVVRQTPIGETAGRLRLRNNVTLSQLEEALSPILPQFAETPNAI